LTLDGMHSVLARFLLTLGPLSSPVMHMLEWVLFFLEAHGDLRALHSFPTRRSSDLSVCVGVFGTITTLVPTFSFSVGSNTTEKRSEEHTSELQSRFDLVCRLLLEKKKCANWLIRCVEFTRSIHASIVLGAASCG